MVFGHRRDVAQLGLNRGQLGAGQKTRGVGIPLHARITQANGHTVLIDIGDDHDFGVARELEALEHMDQQQAKNLAEVHLLLGCDALVAEHQ